MNGAQIFYKTQFGIGEDDYRSTWLVGLVNAAPYLCCALIGCWLTVPFNHWFGRRGTVFITCCFSALTCFWQGFVNTWWHMFIARFALGFGIGPKSATVPIYAAETSPPAIRGALVMQWQMWTAFGIMLGYASDLIFFNVPDLPGVVGLGWRLMMGSAMFPAVLVCFVVFLCPESPRWYLSKGSHPQAYRSMCRLRFNKVQAARDLFYMHTLLEAEATMKLGQPKLIELITVPRNRRAMLASEIVMFLQQVCIFGYIYTLSYEQTNMSRTVLRRKRNSLLFFRGIPPSRFLSFIRPLRLSRLRSNKLAFRHSRHIHNRYFRPAQSPPHHLPLNGPIPLPNRFLILDPRQSSPNRLRRIRYIPIRHRLLTRRRASPFHLFCRSVPAIRSVLWHGARYSHNVVFQLHTSYYVA